MFARLPVLIICFVFYLMCVADGFAITYGDKQPIATDSRIKTFVYSESEVFPVVLHYGYQTSIEFGEGEYIQTYSVGNNYAWQFTNVGRTLFIKPLEENILTNMTVITNKRRYYFELQSKMVIDAADQDVAYAIRFFYPNNDDDAVKPQHLMKQAKNTNNGNQMPTIQSGDTPASMVPAVKPYNFAYQITGAEDVKPNLVFDNGTNTFFQYDLGIKEIPVIYVANGNKLSKIDFRKMGNYFVVNTIASGFELAFGRQKVKIVAQSTK